MMALRRSCCPARSVSPRRRESPVTLGERASNTRRPSTGLPTVCIRRCYSSERAEE